MQPPPLPADWPHRTTSRHIRCGAHLWHVQDTGTGPTLLLIHGAGGATHSFGNIIPLLAAQYRVIALDLPGQGFSIRGRHSPVNLDAIAKDIATLSAQEHWAPLAIIGHSAGGAVALRIAEIAPPCAVIGINAALGAFDGVAGWLFPAMANLLSRLPLVPQLVSKLAGTPTQARQLLASTGSKIDAQGQAQYLHLLRQPSHIAGTLDMMAQWQLDGLIARLKHQSVPCLLITASGDRTVPSRISQRAAAQMQNARCTELPNLGHLMHEEAPAAVAAIILPFLATCKSNAAT